jgi:nucleoside phosphorylase
MAAWTAAIQESHASAVRARPRLRYMDYKVGWICALEKELAVGEAMLDEIHESLPAASNDTNTCTLGRIGSHNIVMACLPAGQYGLNNASIVGVNMLRTFQFIEKRLLAGIGGGIPDSIDVRLGDVVVSDQVIQYDHSFTGPASLRDPLRC